MKRTEVGKELSKKVHLNTCSYIKSGCGASFFTLEIKFSLLIIGAFVTQSLLAQDVAAKLKAAIENLQNDPKNKHASISLYVVDSKTGKAVFDYNSQVGLVPASCQKILTSIAAFELLGKDYQYKTKLGYAGAVKKGTLNGNLFVIGHGDPTLGSWRYPSTKDSVVLNDWMQAIKRLGIKKINGNIILDGNAFSLLPVPGGWPWEDMGNYYGAGCWGLNWFENQYDLALEPSRKIGEKASIISTSPPLANVDLINQVKTSSNDDGEEAAIYLTPYSTAAFVMGTVPVGDKNSVISGATANPFNQIGKLLKDNFQSNKIKYTNITNSLEYARNNQIIPKPDSIFYTYLSPTLDSITYWFLRKSINLYGEALIKTLAYNKTGEGTTATGVGIVKQFWLERGIESTALHISDGSGLSPKNRLTTNALVTALQYAKDKPWFPSFYEALPSHNEMKLKSGTIGGTKSFAGYYTNKQGTDYTLAIIINNFDGSSAEMAKKLFLVLDKLK